VDGAVVDPPKVFPNPNEVDGAVVPPKLNPEEVEGALPNPNEDCEDDVTGANNEVDPVVVAGLGALNELKLNPAVWAVVPKPNDILVNTNTNVIQCNG
jgi:hypothetical protein